MASNVDPTNMLPLHSQGPYVSPVRFVELIVGTGTVKVLVRVQVAKICGYGPEKFAVPEFVTTSPQ